MGGVNLLGACHVDRRRGDRDDSGQMVDRFQQDVVDRHPEMVVILAGTNAVSPDSTLCEEGGLEPLPRCGLHGRPG